MMRALDAGGPFGGPPDPEVFFPGAGREAACQALILDILAGKRFLRLGGEEGSGKTQLCQVLMSRLPGEITPVYQPAPTGSFDELMRHACVDLGAAKSGGDAGFTWAGEFDRLLALRLEEGARVVLILDQAERLFAATLERLLTRVRQNDAPPFGILLSGSDELDGPLSQLASLNPAFRPDASWTLAPLDRDETEQYLRSRLHAAGFGWNEQDALLNRKRVDRIFREARGNIAATNEAAARVLDLGGAGQDEVSERQLPLWGEDEGGEPRRTTVLSPRITPPTAPEPIGTQPETALADATAQAEVVAKEAAESVIVAEAAEAAFSFENIAPQSAMPGEPEELPAKDEDEKEDGGLWSDLAEKLDALEGLIATPVIALYDKLWGDKRMLGSALGLALFFCVLGLSLGTADQPATPAPPVETPAAAPTPGNETRPLADGQPAALPGQPAQATAADGQALLRERLAAGRSLVAASYRGAHTVQMLSLSGDRAERDLAELLATPPFRREIERLYVVRKPGATPAFFLFYGIFDDAEQARQARNNMGFELRAHHPYPLPVGEALRLNED